jgi:hypothetical protein
MSRKGRNAGESRMLRSIGRTLLNRMGDGMGGLAAQPIHQEVN